jgi:pimeloyl-ACP methyl ester carboxylesterase
MPTADVNGVRLFYELLGPVVAKLSDALPNVEIVTFPGAGHIPHVTHPDAYVEAIVRFINENPT